MRRLSFRLMGSFGAVILVGAVVLVLLANRVTESEFQFYITREGQQWAERLAPSLASFYAYNKSWNDVDTFLQTRDTASSPGDMGSMMNRMGGMGGQGWNWRPMMGWDMWPLVDWRLVLTDAQGKVVADSANELIGHTIPADSLKNATPIQVDGRNVGSLAVTPGQAVPTTNTTAKDYLNSVNRSILFAVLASSAIALALGFILLRQITLPLSALTVAAKKIAAGDLKQRVELPDGDEIGELSHAFNTMADNLARQEEIRRNLVADIAHDLRNPLAVIQGELEAIIDGVVPLKVESIASVHEETVLLSRLVSDLRTLSLAEVGQLKLSCEMTDIVDLVRRVTERMQRQAQEKAVGLKLDVPESIPSVFIDADRVAQVIRNLASNALRHTPSGGQVIVRVRSLSGAVEIGVIDTGTGIAPEDLPHVFDRFYRGHKSQPQARDGSGLGLAIVKHLVEAHGGSVGVESRGPSGRGKGTRFWFILPITPNFVKPKEMSH